MTFDDAARRTALALLERQLDDMAAHYRGVVIDHFKIKAQAVLAAETPLDATRISRKVYDAVQVHLLASWGSKLISGPVRCDADRADEAEKLADFLSSKGDEEGAAQQRARAAQLRLDLAAQPGVHSTSWESGASGGPGRRRGSRTSGVGSSTTAATRGRTRRRR